MRIRLVLPALVTLFLAGEAAADDNPAVQACSGKTKGTACTFMKAEKEAGGPMTQTEVAGTCQDDRCCELDYSKGSPPTSDCGPCLMCKEGGGAAAGEVGGEAANSGPNQEAPRAGDDPPASGGNGKRGCAIGGVPTGGVAALVGILLVATLRRRRR